MIRQNYTKISNKDFRIELGKELTRNQEYASSFTVFYNLEKKCLNKHTPLLKKGFSKPYLQDIQTFEVKTKYLRANESPFVTKEI